MSMNIMIIFMTTVMGVTTITTAITKNTSTVMAMLV
jgi:hypothetical protein